MPDCSTASSPAAEAGELSAGGLGADARLGGEHGGGKRTAVAERRQDPNRVRSANRAATAAMSMSPPVAITEGINPMTPRYFHLVEERGGILVPLNSR